MLISHLSCVATDLFYTNIIFKYNLFQSTPLLDQIDQNSVDKYPAIDFLIKPCILYIKRNVYSKIKQEFTTTIHAKVILFSKQTNHDNSKRIFFFKEKETLPEKKGNTTI